MASRHPAAARNSPPTHGSTSSSAAASIGQHLIQRLQDCGVRDIFGIPGDYVLSFFIDLVRSPIRVISCTREDCAGFAADAYARLHGIGAVCVTYCVGGLSVCNSIAGAYAEKSPVVLISGAPGLRERINNPLLHHKVKDFRTQFEVFRRLCVAATDLTDPATAFREIDRVLEAVRRYKRPGYIELPRDLVHVVPEGPYRPVASEAASNPEVLAEAVAEAERRLRAAQRPVILAGVEIHRFGLQEQLVAWAERTGLPITATLLGKSVVSERHPQFVGIYEGALGHENVTRFVEESDLVIILGAFMTDINLGIFTAHLDPGKCLYATSESLRISHHHFHGVQLADFLRGLCDLGIRVPSRPLPPRTRPDETDFQLRPEAPITIRRLIERLNHWLDDTMVVVAEAGDALFASTELVIHRQTEFISPAYYTSMGFAVPAAVGAQFARPDLRPVVLLGDGAFQMTGTELSTAVRYGLNPIVIVLDNQGYGTERRLHAGDYDFNEIQPWHYHRLPEILGGGRGYEVRTEGDFDQALRAAWADRGSMSLVQVHLQRDDCSGALERLAQRVSPRV
jgi:indolepyruvate decarboxylase